MGNHNRFGKVKGKAQQLRSAIKNRYTRLRNDERALKAFGRGYTIAIVYLSLLSPVHAVDKFDELLDKALQNITDHTLDELVEELFQKFMNQTLTNQTPAETVGRLAALKNWFQKLNLSDFRQCFTAFGLSQLVGCSPYYIMGFVSGLLTYKLYKRWKLK